MNLSINMSIIKHNEFKSSSRTSGPKTPRDGDIAVENLEFAMVEDPMKSQDYQLALNKVDRQRRAIFLEQNNSYVGDMNEYVMYNYAEQIKQAFPNDSRKINNILNMQKPFEISSKD
jgi:hypothetical protein